MPTTFLTHAQLVRRVTVPARPPILPLTEKDGTIWTPSSMISRMGREINNEESVYYWCWKNNIPVFCPAITDGSVGGECQPKTNT